MPDYTIIHETIPKLVSGKDNLNLTKVPDYTEICQTIFDMDPLSALGPDGFTRKFFCYCWDVVGLDIVVVVQDLFKTGFIYPCLNSNFIILVPKVEYAISVDKFRPIALSNFLLKVITKILVD